MEKQIKLFDVEIEKTESKEQIKIEKKAEKNWLDFRDRIKDGSFSLTDEEINRIPLVTLRCWKFYKTGCDWGLNEKGESDYCCGKCAFQDLCHSQQKTPFEMRWEELHPQKAVEMEKIGKKNPNPILHTPQKPKTELDKIKAETICPLVVCEQVGDKIIEKEIIEPKIEPKKFIIDVENRSSGEYAIFPKAEGSFYLASYVGKIGDGKKEEEIAKLKQEITEKGFVFDKLIEHSYTYESDKPEFIEKKIKELSEELKKYLVKKYKMPVTIRVLKEETKC